MDERVTIFVRGHVQGVGFRWWVRSQAAALGLDGHARNLSDGRVEVVAQGPSSQVSTLVQIVQEQPSSRHRPGRVTGAVVQYGTAHENVRGFVEL